MQLKYLLLIFIFFTFIISVTPDDSCFCQVNFKIFGKFETPDHYEPIVGKLIEMITNKGWEANFTKAVSDAHNTETIEMTNIKDLTDYYNFLNYLIRWVPSEDITGSVVVRMLCTMYLVLDQESVINYQTLPSNTTNPNEPFSDLTNWIIEFDQQMGQFLDKPESLTKETLQTFYTAQNYDIDAYKEPDGGWGSFNEFFMRKFLPDTRPIDRLNDSHVVVSAADSTFLNCFDIDDDSKVTLKGITWSIKELLADTEHAGDFAGGKFMHAFLGPDDYHRQHAPVEGEILEAKVIQGLAYLEVTTKKQNCCQQPSIVSTRKTEDCTTTVDAPDSPGYQFRQTRGLFVIKSEFGLVAVLPVGMAQVSSVKITEGIKEHVHVKKGQEISYFQFGGSDIVYVFQKASNVSVTAIKNRHYRVGEQIAIIRPQDIPDIPIPTHVV